MMRTLMSTAVLLIALTAYGQKPLDMRGGTVVIDKEECMMKNVDGQDKCYKDINTLMTGIVVEKFPNGRHKHLQEYTNGIPHGTWMTYFENGNFKEVGSMYRNEVKGAVRLFYESGKIESTGIYAKDKLKVGIWTYFDENGDVTKKMNYGDDGKKSDSISF